MNLAPFTSSRFILTNKNPDCVACESVVPDLFRPAFARLPMPLPLEYPSGFPEVSGKYDCPNDPEGLDQLTRDV